MKEEIQTTTIVTTNNLDLARLGSESAPDSLQHFVRPPHPEISPPAERPRSPVDRCQWLDDELMQCQNAAVGRFIAHGEPECHGNELSVAVSLCDAHRINCSVHQEWHRPSERSERRANRVLNEEKFAETENLTETKPPKDDE